MPPTVLDKSYPTKNYEVQGGAKTVIGGNLDIAQTAGGSLTVDGVDVTSAVATGGVAGVAAGYKIARGQATTGSASDTIVTGLATVVSAVANLESAPVLTCERASAAIGDQAGSPAAGSIYIQTWMPTSSSVTTPIAATTFSKLVNWIAVGT